MDSIILLTRPEAREDWRRASLRLSGVSSPLTLTSPSPRLRRAGLSRGERGEALPLRRWGFQDGGDHEGAGAVLADGADGEEVVVGGEAGAAGEAGAEVRNAYLTEVFRDVTVVGRI